MQPKPGKAHKSLHLICAPTRARTEGAPHSLKLRPLRYRDRRPLPWSSISHHPCRMRLGSAKPNSREWRCGFLWRRVSAFRLSSLRADAPNEEIAPSGDFGFLQEGRRHESQNGSSSSSSFSQSSGGGSASSKYSLLLLCAGKFTYGVKTWMSRLNLRLTLPTRPQRFFAKSQ